MLIAYEAVGGSRQEPVLHKHTESLGIPRDFVWTLLRLPITETFPLVMRVRVLDFVLVKGCLVLVSIALVRSRRSRYMSEPNLMLTLVFSRR
jgi:hypothetical protein